MSQCSIVSHETASLPWPVRLLSPPSQVSIADTHACDTALGIYDWLITLNQEYRQIWRRKISWISVLFVINRYVTLMTSFVMFVKDIPVVAPNSKVSGSSVYLPCTVLTSERTLFFHHCRMQE